MDPERQMVKRRLRQRVLFGPPKSSKSSIYDILTQDNILSALLAPPSERTTQEIDIILNSVGKWPEFVKQIKNVQERREICRRIECEEYRANSLVYKEGNSPDGWYFVFSGMCTIYTLDISDQYQEQIPPLHLIKLQERFGKDKYFRYRSKLSPKMDFGMSSLTSDNSRKETVYCDVPTVILRIDPKIYESTNSWFSHSFLDKKASLLSQIPELKFLLELSDSDIYHRLAENMVEHRYEFGTIIESGGIKMSSHRPRQRAESIDDDEFFSAEMGERGFLIVEEGLLSKERLIDFSDFKLTRLQETTADMPLKIPKGKHKVSIGKFGPKSIVPHPALLGFFLHPFSIRVVETVTCYELKPKELTTLLFSTQIEQIKKITFNEPDDLQVFLNWKENQEAENWKIFKKNCVKDARKKAKMQKDMSGGQWVMRKPEVPKSLKPISKSSNLIRKKYDDY